MFSNFIKEQHAILYINLQLDLKKGPQNKSVLVVITYVITAAKFLPLFEKPFRLSLCNITI